MAKIPNLTLEERARNTFALLDARRPHWRSEIREETLKMNDMYECLFGQLWGHYNTGIDALGIRERAHEYLIFNIPPVAGGSALMRAMVIKEVQEDVH